MVRQSGGSAEGFGVGRIGERVSHKAAGGLPVLCARSHATTTDRHAFETSTVSRAHISLSKPTAVGCGDGPRIRENEAP